MLSGIQKKMASTIHHTAATIYPCCVPTLGDSTGAGCVGLAGAKIHCFLGLTNIFNINYYGYLGAKILKPDDTFASIT